MDILRVALTCIFIVICIALTVLVLAQEGKSAGLGTIGGAAESFWTKNKARSMEGKMVKITKVLAVLFVVLAAILNISRF
ncbi:MAG: preprotein translocase subunit SecG [Lachnospiraceae bacterium]